jgi:hypothetical protein
LSELVCSGGTLIDPLPECLQVFTIDRRREFTLWARDTSRLGIPDKTGIEELQGSSDCRRILSAKSSNH